MVVSTRVLSATLAIGVTVPSASSRTGTCLRTALATSTGTGRLALPRRAGCWAAARSAGQ